MKSCVYWKNINIWRKPTNSCGANCYEGEIFCEDALMKWKDDINDSYPGKQKALFDAHEWLKWLETAEEEDDSD